MKTTKPHLLVILDGFGFSPSAEYNAAHYAHTPTLDSWLLTYPHTLLDAAGTSVGLLPGTIGNSEVGHLTIGTGRTIPSAILSLHKAMDDGTLFKHPLLLDRLQRIQDNVQESFLDTPTTRLHNTKARVHLMGLLSDAGVHSHEQHLYALIKMLSEMDIRTIVHAFLDGRDVPPKSAEKALTRLEKECKRAKSCVIGSIHGRYYAMDRDANWDRIEKSYRALTQPETPRPWKEILKEQYHKKIFDEFIFPAQVTKNCTIQDGDGIIFFNVRPDRARQLTRCFVLPETIPFAKEYQLAWFITPTEYDATLETDILLPSHPIKHTLKEILAAHGKTIFTIAETEKYAHVTYFFNGGKEATLATETRALIPSLKTKTYIEHPEMSARAITDAVINSLETDPKDFYVINYANADMVGHSGDFEATKKAVECLDRELKKLYAVVHKLNGVMYVTADHGNAEDMLDNATGQPKTAHTNNKVPFIEINNGKHNRKLPLKELADIAPFILHEMGLPVPKEMKRKNT